VSENITVIAVHGAWADGSSWKDVILKLERVGVRIIAASIPLTSVGDDASALKRTVAEMLPQGERVGTSECRNCSRALSWI
jgi:hypothetical protein